MCEMYMCPCQDLVFVPLAAMQGSGGLQLGVTTQADLAGHRLLTRARLGKILEPTEFAGREWVVEWGIRALSLSRKKGKINTDATMYCRDVHHTFSRYLAGVNVLTVPPGTVIAMTDSRFQRFTNAAIKATETQKAIATFTDIVDVHEAEMAKVTESIRGADPPCPSCRSGDVVHTGSEQLRSADEPMTEFWKCKHCDHRWQT